MLDFPLVLHGYSLMSLILVEVILERAGIYLTYLSLSQEVEIRFTFIYTNIVILIYILFI